MAHVPPPSADHHDGDGSEGTKKPYESPCLITYGDIREIASNVGMMGAADGALHGQTKTQ